MQVHREAFETMTGHHDQMTTTYIELFREHLHTSEKC